jgi:hypothetical protein
VGLMPASAGAGGGAGRRGWRAGTALVDRALNRHAEIVARRSLFASIFRIAQPSEKAGARRLCESIDLRICGQQLVGPQRPEPPAEAVWVNS